MKGRIATLLGAAVVAFNAAPAAAQEVCGERGKFMAHLGSNYQEQPIAMGLSSAGTVVEVLSSASGSWTLLVTYPTGRSCMVATGQNWEALALTPMLPETPSRPPLPHSAPMPAPPSGIPGMPGLYGSPDPFGKAS